jgi:hypothetical protein
MLANVNNVRIVQSATVGLDGRVSPVKRVTYYVGDQGPFTDNYPEELYTPENVYAGQAKNIVNLHQIGVPLPHPPEPVPGQEGHWRIPILPTPIKGAPVGPAPAPIGHMHFTSPKTA